MEIDKITNIIGSLWEKRLVNYVLGRRLCQKCAKREWKDEDKNQSFTMLVGICSKCGKGGLVAYIEKG